jgi:hypothetical protein
MHPHCLNCNQPVHGNFCAHCGQKATTHRFSLRHFLVHDLIKKVFHFDKGILHTVKALFTRPGNSTREYIQGKRVQFLDYFTFIVLVIAFGHFVGTLSDIPLIDTTWYFSGDEAFVSRFSTITRENPKLFTLIRIPFLALFSFWFYYQYFSAFEYSKWSLSARSILTAIILILVTATVTTFALGVNDGFNDTL